MRTSDSDLRTPGKFSPLLIAFRSSAGNFLYLLNNHRSADRSSKSPLQIDGCFYFLCTEFLLHLPHHIFPLKQEQPYQHQKADAYTDQRRIQHRYHTGSQQDHRDHSSESSCFQKIDHIFRHLQLLYRSDHLHGADHSKRSQRKQIIHRPATPAGKHIPKHSCNSCDHQLPHLILQKIPPLHISH